MKHKLESVLTELRRELATRRRVYPDWIRRGQLRQIEANFRIEALEDAIELIEGCKPEPP